MKSPIRISVVSYLNSTPFIFGLKNWTGSPSIDLQLDIPSICAEKLISGRVEIGLVPVAILKQLGNYNIISDYCIGAEGKVTSVLLLSEVPLENIKTIYLDYQSRTSVMLTRILAREYWKIDPEFENTSTNYEKLIEGPKAGVVIGDRALELSGKFPYQYDLSEEWQKMTGLPFVFAVWVSHDKLPESFLLEFNRSLKQGFAHMDEVIERAVKDYKMDKSLVETYLKESISYDLTERKRKALSLFLDHIK